MRLQVDVLLPELQEVLLGRFRLQLALVAIRAAILPHASTLLLRGLRLLLPLDHNDSVMCLFKGKLWYAQTYSGSPSSVSSSSCSPHPLGRHPDPTWWHRGSGLRSHLPLLLKTYLKFFIFEFISTQ